MHHLVHPGSHPKMALRRILVSVLVLWTVSSIRAARGSRIAHERQPLLPVWDDPHAKYRSLEHSPWRDLLHRPTVSRWRVDPEQAASAAAGRKVTIGVADIDLALRHAIAARAPGPGGSSSLGSGGVSRLAHRLQTQAWQTPFQQSLAERCLPWRPQSYKLALQLPEASVRRRQQAMKVLQDQIGFEQRTLLVFLPCSLFFGQGATCILVLTIKMRW